jgi:hypothetical protein
LPRAVATYRVTPVDSSGAKNWLESGELTTLIRTTEQMEAIEAGLGVTLDQSDTAMTLQPGDEALLISLSFSVLLAWSQGSIVPLPEDWRCLRLEVESPSAVRSPLSAETAVDLRSGLVE